MHQSAIKLGLIAAFLAVIPSSAKAEMIAFVAPGEAARGARRAVLRSHQILEGQEGILTLDSQELRRALAGLPATGEGDDPLADVRALVVEAAGDDARDALQQLGNRLDVELLVTVRQAGEELEFRVFDVEERAFYRGTLMLPVAAPPDQEELLEFLLPRARVTDSRTSAEGGEVEEGRSRQGSIWRRWWVWVLIGGGVGLAVLLGYFATPNEIEDTGVTLRIAIP